MAHWKDCCTRRMRHTPHFVQRSFSFVWWRKYGWGYSFLSSLLVLFSKVSYYYSQTSLGKEVIIRRSNHKIANQSLQPPFQSYTISDKTLMPCSLLISISKVVIAPVIPELMIAVLFLSIYEYYYHKRIVEVLHIHQELVFI